MKLVLLLLGVVLTAGCSSSGSRGGTVVTYTRIGGFAGLNDTLVVGADGSLTATDKFGAVRHGSAAAADVKRLDELVRGKEFRALAASYSTKGADQLTYTVSVPGVGKVSTMDGVQHPDILAQIMAECDRMMGQVK